MNNTCPMPAIPTMPGPLFPVNSAVEYNPMAPQEILVSRLLITAVPAMMTAVLAICTRNAYRILRGTHLMKVPMCVYGPIAHCKPIEERDTCEKISMCTIMLMSGGFTALTAAATGFLLYKTLS